MIARMAVKHEWADRTRGLQLITALSLAIAVSRTAHAVTPESPEVKQTVEHALKWLETQSDDRLGGQCLIGLAFFKAGRPATHPKVVAAVEACRAALATGDPVASDVAHWNYSLGLAAILLLETDAEKNRDLANRYLNIILRRQRPDGAWSYVGDSMGDTSQTQYPTLALWLAMRNGLDVSTAAIEKDCSWLLRTQDPAGGWSYKGKDPGNHGRVPQDEVKPSVSAAGLGSLYICADLLGLEEKKAKSAEPGLPAALKPVGDPLEVKRPAPTTSIDSARIRRAMADGNSWFTNHYTMQSEPYTFYYLYAYERYRSFRELAERRSETNPRWYDDVYAYLKKTQQPDSGGWNDASDGAVATSFAVLTLMRSTKKTIGHIAASLGEGVLLGGRGLPPKTADLQEREGRLVESPLTGTVDELLTTIEKASTPEIERMAESSARWKLDADVTKRSSELVRLRALVSAGDYASRLLAVRLLGRTHELDNVPLLIYALSDPDVRVVVEADKGLKFISRKFEGVGLPAEPKPHNIKDAIATWKAWYRSVRPTGEFLD
jgi:hypothetical protein